MYDSFKYIAPLLIFSKKSNPKILCVFLSSVQDPTICPSNDFNISSLLLSTSAELGYPLYKIVSQVAQLLEHVHRICMHAGSFPALTPVAFTSSTQYLSTTMFRRAFYSRYIQCVPISPTTLKNHFLTFLIAHLEDISPSGVVIRN